MNRVSIFFASTFFAAAITFAGCGSSDSGDASEVELPELKKLGVSRADLGAEWPLTVESGEVSCRESGALVFRSGGINYALNGYARDMGLPDIRDITAKSDGAAGGTKSVMPIFNKAQSLCEQQQ